MLSDDEIENWKKKYPFLETIIQDCSNLFGIIEEDKTRNEGLERCRTSGYDCTQGESISWRWYGIRNGVAKTLEGGSLGEVMSKERFDYVITHEHITTDIFEDDTICIYKLREDAVSKDTVSKDTVSKDIASSTKDFPKYPISQDWIKRSREYGSCGDMDIASSTKDFLNSSRGQDWVKRSMEYGFWAELEELEED